MSVTFTDCQDCGSQHLGGRCGLTFRDRLRTVRLDTAAMETRTKKNYYDAEALEDVVGDNAWDRLMADTEGRGAATREEDGSLTRIDMHGVKHDVTAEDIDFYTSGPEVDDPFV